VKYNGVFTKCNLTICVFDTLVFQRSVNKLMFLMNDDFDGLQINVVWL